MHRLYNGNMRRFLPSFIIIMLICIISLPCQARGKKNSASDFLPNIYITDVSEAEADLGENPSVLKGYAEYLEAEDEISLKDENGNFVLNLKVPQKISPRKLGDESKKIRPKKIATYSKFGSEEYQIAPKGKNATVSIGDLVFGTSYDQEVDYAEFEQTTGLHTKYSKGPFAIGSAYKRTIGSAFQGYSDSLYIIPEFKLNKMLTLKEVLSQNFTFKTYKAEFVVSINPFAYTKSENDRLNFEVGAGQIYNNKHELTRNRIRFNTKFKL